MKKFLEKLHIIWLSLFGTEQQIEKFLEDHVDDAINIITQILGVLGSPVITVIEAILPPGIRTASKLVIDNVVKYLGYALDDLNFYHTECEPLTDTLSKINCFLNAIRQHSVFTQHAMLVKLGQRYVFHSSGKALPEAVADTAVQARFLTLKHPDEIAKPIQLGAGKNAGADFQGEADLPTAPGPINTQGDEQA